MIENSFTLNFFSKTVNLFDVLNMGTNSSEEMKIFWPTISTHLTQKYSGITKMSEFGQIKYFYTTFCDTPCPFQARWVLS